MLSKILHALIFPTIMLAFVALLVYADQEKQEWKRDMYNACMQDETCKLKHIARRK